MSDKDIERANALNLQAQKIRVASEQIKANRISKKRLKDESQPIGKPLSAVSIWGIRGGALILVVYGIYGLLGNDVFSGFRTLRNYYKNDANLVSICHVLIGVSVLIGLSQKLNENLGRPIINIIVSALLVVGMVCQHYATPG